jgi:hypothetical protein
MKSTRSIKVPVQGPRPADPSYVSPQRRDEILMEAVEQFTPIVVTTRTAEIWQMFKSRFVGGECGRNLVIERPMQDGAGVGATLEACPGQELGIAFRRGHKKCLFGARVQQPTRLGDSPAAGLALEWPQNIQEMQRRVYLRVPPPPDQSIEVHCWRGGVRCAEQQPACLTGNLSDLSAGGVALTSMASIGFALGDAVGCQFTLNEEPFMLDATVRHIGRDCEGRNALGLQFIGLEMTMPGQAMLARLARAVTALHRSHTRRTESRWRRNGRRL